MLKHKSVVDTYTKNALILIIFSVVTIGILISISSLYEFVQGSEQLENESASLQRGTLQREVVRVEALIHFERSKLQSIIRKNIRERVYEAHAIATGIYEKYKNIKSKAEVQELIVESLRPHRFFEDRGYFYVLTLDGKGVLNPITPELEGKDLTSFRTENGSYYIRELTSIAAGVGEGSLSGRIVVTP